jgi:hypothetical protein
LWGIEHKAVELRVANARIFRFERFELSEREGVLQKKGRLIQ